MTNAEFPLRRCPDARPSVPKRPVSRWRCQWANLREELPTTCMKSWVTTPCKWRVKVAFICMSRSRGLTSHTAIKPLSLLQRAFSFVVSTYVVVTANKRVSLRPNSYLTLTCALWIHSSCVSVPQNWAILGYHELFNLMWNYWEFSLILGQGCRMCTDCLRQIQNKLKWIE